ncbi:MAG: glycosyltransferase family 2 protein [Opitutaceae bacterium]|nr:glycosyltransferase family 2 protein [Cytophagales bacterium]
MKVAVVILTWNGLRHLKTFLPSVVQHSIGHAIFVIDNGSLDGSKEWLSTTYPTISVIRLDRNLGFCDGYNKGLQQIKSEYYVLLNSDVEVTDGWIEPLIDIFDKKPEVAAIQPKILSFENKTSFEYAGAAGGHIDWLGYPFCRGRIFDTLEEDNGQYNDISEIFWASGACLFIRSHLFHKHAGFDWAFFAHMEEIDLCWRLKNLGYKILYSSESTVYHLGGGTLQKSSPYKTFLNYRNGLFLLYKNLPGSKLYQTIIIRLFLDGISGLRHVFKLEFRFVSAILKAHFSFYAHILLGKIKRNNSLNTFSEPILKSSVVYKYFILNLKYFSEIIK